MKKHLELDSNGISLCGYLDLSTTEGPFPLGIMYHSFSAINTKHIVLAQCQCEAEL